MGQWRGEGGGTIGSWPRDSLTVCGITATGSGGPAVALLFVVFPSAPGSRRPQLSIAPQGPRLTRRAELEGKEGLGQEQPCSLLPPPEGGHGHPARHQAPGDAPAGLSSWAPLPSAATS